MADKMNRDPRTWKSLADRFGSLFGAALAGPGRSLGKTFGAVRRPLPYALDAARSVAAGPAAEALAREHPQLHVEPLLDEASRLLDRAQVERERHNALAEAAARTALEMQELSATDRAHDSEIAAGLLKYPCAEARAWVEAARQERATAGDVGDRYRRLLEDGPLGPAQRQGFADRLATLFRVLKLPWVRNIRPDTVFLYEGSSLDQVAYDRAYKNAGQDIAVRAETATVHWRAAAGQSAVAEARLPGLEKRLAALEKIGGIRAAAAQAARAVFDRRLEESVRDGGILNYPQRLAPIKTCIEQDFVDAWARLLSVRRGMATLYGIELPLPDPGAERLFDDTVDWVRKASERLARLRRREQDYIFSISLRERLGKAFKGRGDWTLDLEQEDFPGQRHVRLRGVAAFALDESGRVYRLAVSAPRTGKIQRLDASQAVSVDQPVPVCWLGRVGPREARLGPEVAGRTTLYNCSPVGEWQISLAEADRKAAEKGLEDLEIDLYLAVIPEVLT